MSDLNYCELQPRKLLKKNSSTYHSYINYKKLTLFTNRLALFFSPQFKEGCNSKIIHGKKNERKYHDP